MKLPIVCWFYRSALGLILFQITISGITPSSKKQRKGPCVSLEGPFKVLFCYYGQYLRTMPVRRRKMVVCWARSSYCMVCCWSNMPACWLTVWCVAGPTCLPADWLYGSLRDACNAPVFSAWLGSWRVSSCSSRLTSSSTPPSCWICSTTAKQVSRQLAWSVLFFLFFFISFRAAFPG